MSKIKLIAGCLITGALLFSCTADKSDEKMTDYYNSVVREISSPDYYGRSLYNDGIFKAADFIIGQLKEFGIGPCSYQAPRENLKEVVGIFGPVGVVPEEVAKTIFPVESPEKEKYFQRFAFPYNTLRGDAILKIDGKEWNPTVDYVFKEFSPTCENEGEIVYLDDTDVYSAEKFVKTLNGKAYKGKFVVVDFDRFNEVFGANRNEPYKAAIVPLKGPAGIIFEYNHRPGFFKSRSSYTTSIPVVAVQKPFSRDSKKAYVKVDSQMFPYPGRNIIAQIEGKKNPDKFVVFTAHYDHLGVMGKDNIFCGANDNASGVAMLLSLAKYYSQPDHRPDDSVIFVFFDGEEANLLGSWYLSANPTFPLDKVKLFINLDMTGDVADSPDSQVLNYQVSKSAEQYLQEVQAINDKNHHFSSFCREELNDDSDNYPFDILGLPALYFSINGKYYKDYHSPRDTFNLDASGNFKTLFDYCTKME